MVLSGASVQELLEKLPPLVSDVNATVPVGAVPPGAVSGQGETGVAGSVGEPSVRTGLELAVLDPRSGVVPSRQATARSDPPGEAARSWSLLQAAAPVGDPARVVTGSAAVS